MMHLMPFMCHILITAAAIFLCIFFYLRPVMVDAVRSLPPESAVTLCACPARTEVRGATVKGSFSRWCLGLVGTQTQTRSDRKYEYRKERAARSLK